MLGIHLHISEQAEVVTGIQSRQVRPQVVLQRSVGTGSLRQFCSVCRIGEEFETAFLDDWFLGRKRPVHLVFRGQLLGLDLAGFDVRLIEGIDPNHRASHCRGDLPAEEFLAEIVSISQRDAHHRMSSFFQRCDFRVLSRVGRAL